MNNVFYWYSAEKAKEVTEAGRKVLSEMMKHFNFDIPEKNSIFAKKEQIYGIHHRNPV